MTVRILVTGGVRSGKSKHAETLLSGVEDVTYIAPGRPADGTDHDWDSRVAAHRSRRPASWSTCETPAVDEAIRQSTGAVLLDCLGTWVAAVLDENGLWEQPSATVDAAVSGRLEDLCDAVGAACDAVIVTNEVGLGVVPSHRSGRLFRDALGTVNQRVAAVCDEVHLVIAGRVLKL